MRKSVWIDSVELPKFKTLKGDKKTDVLIIGGGICGILCAYLLKQSGTDCIVVEGSTICSGTTKNTTAKITSQHGLIYNKLLENLGKEKAQLYLNANEMAVAEFSMFAKGIDCDFEIKSAYTYSLTDSQKIEDEIKAVNSLGFKAQFSETRELPFETIGAICFPNQAQFNPLKFIAEISKKLEIYENTFIRDITPQAAISDNGKITAKKIIVATHFPFINKHGAYFLKLYQDRSYVSAYENAKKIEGMYVDEVKNGLSFSSYDDLLFIGGGGHRTGKNGENWGAIEKIQKAYYPNSFLRYSWSTQDCMSLDSIPYIGKYSARTPNLFVATGFNKWGMSSSMVAAQILCDLVNEKPNDFAELFTPERSILKPQLLVNTAETLTNFLTPTVKRCPHLGCALKWNKTEHSWDCPCHGSRFDKNGKLIDNPSTGDARV